MKIWLKVILITLGIFFILLGMIFFMAAFSPFTPIYMIEGVVFFILGSAPIAAVILVEMKKSSAPVNVTNKIEIKADDLVGGDKSYEKLKCQNCGGDLGSNDVKFTDMGLIVNCPYCSTVYAIEEKPKW